VVVLKNGFKLKEHICVQMREKWSLQKNFAFTVHYHSTSSESSGLLRWYRIQDAGISAIVSATFSFI